MSLFTRTRAISTDPSSKSSSTKVNNEGGTILSELVNTICSSDGSLTIAQCSTFWKALCNPSLCSHYVHCLAAEIFLLENNVDSSCTVSTILTKLYNKEDVKALSKGPTTLDENSAEFEMKQSCINTLYYLLLFFSFDLGDDKHSHVFNSLQNTSYERGQSNAFLQSMCRLFPLNFSEQNESIVGLMDVGTSIDCHKGLMSLPPSCPSKMAFYSSPSFISLAIRNYLYIGKHRNLILESCNVYFKYPLITTGRILSLLQFVRMCFTICPYSYSYAGNINLLKEAITRIKPYFLWPLPYGLVAKDALTALTRELKCPGSLLRSMIYSEYPTLRPVLSSSNSSNSSSSSPTASASASTTPISDDGLAHRIHFLVNKKSSGGNNFYEHLSSVTPDDVPINEILIWIVTMSFLCVITPSDVAAAKIYKKTTDQLKGYLKRIESIYEESNKMSTEAAQGYVVQNMRLAFAVVTSDSVSAESAKIPDRENYLLTTPPPLEYEYITLRQEKMDNVETLGSLCFPKLSIANTMEQIIKDHAAKQLPLVKFVIVGGDGTLMHVATSYLGIKQLQPELFANLEVRFYVLPLGKDNFFANFMALYDGWYGRHILGGLNAFSHILPTRASNSDKAIEKKLGMKSTASFSGDLSTFSSAEKYRPSSDLNKEFPSDVNGLNKIEPCVVLRRFVDSYIRDAQQILPINIYQCETWCIIDNKTCYRTISFIQRVELGMPVFKYKTDNNLLRDKKEKFIPPEFLIKFTQMNCAGMARNSEPLDNRPYQSLSIVNVPRSTDKGICACPTSAWLEMYAVEESKKKRTGKTENQGQTHHIGYTEIKVEDRKKPFEVLIDGELFGPLIKIRISACKASDSSEIITFPVATFFPFEM